MAQNKNNILFKNSGREKVTVYFYRSWDVICLLSWFSKIIEPGDELLHRVDYCFKYQILNGQNGLTRVRPWNKNLHIEISESGRIEEEDLDMTIPRIVELVDYYDFLERVTKNDVKDLYAILKMNRKEVRKMKSVEEQTNAIKEKYEGQRDLECSNAAIKQEINEAYEILKDPKTRKRYHNYVDENGWCLKYKVIYWPEVENEEKC